VPRAGRSRAAGNRPPPGRGNADRRRPGNGVARAERRPADVVVSTGRFNPSYVTVFDGATLDEVDDFDGFSELPLDSFDPVMQQFIATRSPWEDPDDRGDDVDLVEGIYLASTGDTDGDGELDVPAGIVLGRPKMRVLNAGDDDEFYPFGEAVVSGVRPVAKDFNGDGRAEIVVGSGQGAARVLVLDGESHDVIRAFDAFPGFTGGVTVG
jgi:hypothetical protein